MMDEEDSKSYICVWEREKLWEHVKLGVISFPPHIYMWTWYDIDTGMKTKPTHTHIHTYIHVYVSLYMHVCTYCTQIWILPTYTVSRLRVEMGFPQTNSVHLSPVSVYIYVCRGKHMDFESVRLNLFSWMFRIWFFAYVNSFVIRDKFISADKD